MLPLLDLYNFVNFLMELSKNNISKLKETLLVFINSDFPFERSDIFNWAPFMDQVDELLESEINNLKISKSIKDRDLLILTLKSTQQILQHSFSKSTQNSVDRLIDLLWIDDMELTLEIVKTV